jgi:ferredoxin-NADP reductase
VNLPKVRHTWIYSNKTLEDVIFARELAELEAKHPERLRVLHTFTRVGDAPLGARQYRGRIGEALLKEAIPDPSSCVVYACGPANGPAEKKAAKEKGVPPAPRFLETCLAALQAIGVPEDRIEYESYG